MYFYIGNFDIMGPQKYNSQHQDGGVSKDLIGIAIINPFREFSSNVTWKQIELLY